VLQGTVSTTRVRGVGACARKPCQFCYISSQDNFFSFYVLCFIWWWYYL